MANYPTSLPSATPALHGDVLGEQIAIATELGVVPKGEYTSVAARLNANRSRLRRILPESYGAAGNARQVFDANITSGAAVLTSTSAVFTSGDVGRTVQVAAAGSGGTSSLVTTVSAFTNSTTVTLAANAAATVSGGIAVIGTNDQTAMQNCLNALAVGEGMYLDPTKAYLHTGVLTIGNPGSGVVGRGTLLGTDQANHTLKVNADDVTVDGPTLRMAADARQLTPESTGLWINVFARTKVAIILVDGAGSAGIFVFGATEFLIEDCVVEYTKADGFHMTFGSRDGVVKRPITRYVGDDGVAVVSYQPDGSICSDISISGARCLGETGGRGISVVGGQDILYTDVYVERASVAGVYIASESVNTTYGVSRVRVLGARLVACNYTANSGNGAVSVIADMASTVVDDVRLEAFVIEDTPFAVFDHVKLSVTAGSTMSRVLLSQFTINGGATEAFTNNGSAGIVSRVSWVQDGKAIADVIGWGGFTGRTFLDGTGGRFYVGATFKGATDSGQQPITTGEFLTPLHTGRGTRALVVGDSGKLWFCRIEQTRKSNLSYGYGQPFTGIGISTSVAQSAGTTGWRCGIYADDGSGSRPTGAFLFDSGASGTALTTTAGDKILTVAWTLNPGIYWLAFGYQETSAPTTRATLVTYTGGLSVPGTGLTSTFPGTAWFQSSFVAASALPTVGTLTRETTPLLVGLKV